MSSDSLQNRFPYPSDQHSCSSLLRSLADLFIESADTEVKAPGFFQDQPRHSSNFTRKEGFGWKRTYEFDFILKQPKKSLASYLERPHPGKLPSAMENTYLNRPGSSGVWHPYHERADEIGVHHGIKGVGPLHDLLTPPGWHIGQAPLNEETVERIRKDNVERLYEVHLATADEYASLLEVQRESLTEEKERLFARSVEIEAICHVERVYVFRKWQALQQAFTFPNVPLVPGDLVSFGWVDPKLAEMATRKTDVPFLDLRYCY